MGTQERWRELRAQGAQIDATARAAPPRRRLEAVPEGMSAAKPLPKPLGLDLGGQPVFLDHDDGPEEGP